MKRRAVKVRLYPNKEQEKLIIKTFGCCRKLYNVMINDVQDYYKTHGSFKILTPASYKKEYTYMKEVDSLALANVQLDLKAAFKSFFKKISNFPRFKSKKNPVQTYTTNFVNNNIEVTDKYIKLPKLGFVRYKHHRIFENARLKSVTIRKSSANKYFASLLYEISESEKQASDINIKEENVLGIDYTMGSLGMYSNGECANYPKYYNKSLSKLKREMRKLSKCTLRSKNYYKQKLKVAKVHERITNQRLDFIHKETLRLANSYAAVVVEDLDLKEMSKDYGKSIHDNAYSTFLNILEYKLKDRGHRLIKINKYYPSSKKCSMCGKVNDDLKLSQRTYICECGNISNRDLNAAINIKNEGIRMLKEQLA